MITCDSCGRDTSTYRKDFAGFAVVCTPKCNDILSIPSAADAKKKAEASLKKLEAARRADQEREAERKRDVTANLVRDGINQASASGDFRLVIARSTDERGEITRNVGDLFVYVPDTLYAVHLLQKRGDYKVEPMWNSSSHLVTW